MKTAKQILVATDYSEASQHALHFAASLARDCGASLLIVHVLETECYPVGELVDDEPRPSAEDVRRFESIVPDDVNVPFERRLVCPLATSENVRPADEIIALADKQKVYAIVVGTYGRAGLSHLLGGGVAASVIQHATCPVITVKCPTA